ncbi:DNA primase (bacterial type) [Bartonella elizabethae]|uniref:toprim domain-containing protein n=1 Tax=Bartonella elizabethae TaxID=807 RepID=UPI000F6C9BC1|nr:toprim domain-containing protein [Bartonella elizabethae]VEJ41860.1 DNA primase (bacterial type) [Bartonella elizabethae]
MSTIFEIKQKLIAQADRIAEMLLPQGHKRGNHWIVGNTRGEPGQSLSICLSGSKAGLWYDFAEGIGGDILDLWCEVKGMNLSQALEEARAVLNLTRPKPFMVPQRSYRRPPVPQGHPPQNRVKTYLHKERHIPLEIIKRYRIGEEGEKIIFPFYKPNGTLALVKERLAQAGAKTKPTAAQCEPILFGWQALYPTPHSATHTSAPTSTAHSATHSSQPTPTAHSATHSSQPAPTTHATTHTSEPTPTAHSAAHTSEPTPTTHAHTHTTEPAAPAHATTHLSAPAPTTHAHTHTSAPTSTAHTTTHLSAPAPTAHAHTHTSAPTSTAHTTTHLSAPAPTADNTTHSSQPAPTAHSAAHSSQPAPTAHNTTHTSAPAPTAHATTHLSAPAPTPTAHNTTHSSQPAPTAHNTTHSSQPAPTAHSAAHTSEPTPTTHAHTHTTEPAAPAHATTHTSEPTPTAHSAAHTSEPTDPTLFPTLSSTNRTLSSTNRTIVITEGEIDALSLAAYGYPAVSVPFGGGKGGKHNWIENEFDHLEAFETIFLATDMDQPGEEAAHEIANRLGRHRCYRVRLPRKDANECLTAGIDAATIKAAFTSAKSFAPEGLRRASDYKDQVIGLFWPEPEKHLGYTVPYPKLKDKLHFRPAELTLWSGASGAGKSQLLSDCIPHWIAQNSRLCLASLEMKGEQSLRRLTKQTGGLEKPTKETIERILHFLDDGLILYEHVGKSSVDTLLDVFDYCRARYGCDQFIIDSLMRLGIASDDYAGQEQAVYKMVDWAVLNTVHIHLVAHARKGGLDKDIPGTEDIKGASEIGANAFNIITIWRNRSLEDKIFAASLAAEKADLVKRPGVIMNIAKQRSGDFEGKVGLWFDPQTYRYRCSFEQSFPRRYL